MSQVPSTSSSSREPVPACFPEDGAAGAAPPSPEAAKAQAPKAPVAKPQTEKPQTEKPQAASPSSVQAYRENDAAQGWVGAGLESAYRALFERVPPGATLRYGLEASARAELAGELVGQVKVKRTQDGAYEITLHNRLGGGVGLGGKKDEASLVGGVRSEVTLRFASAEEAADKLAALHQVGVRFSPVGQALWLTGGLDSDAAGRARGAVAENVKAFELGLYGQFKAKVDALVTKLDFKAVENPRMRVDVEKGTVSIELSQDVGAKVGGPKLEAGVGPVKVSASGGALANLQRQDTLRLQVKLTPAELAQLRQGQLDPRTLLDPQRVQTTLVQQFEGELAGARVQGRRELPVEGRLPTQDSEAGAWEVRASLDLSSGGEAGLKSGAFTLKGELKLSRPLFSDDVRTLTLGELEEAVLREVQEQRREDALVQAQLAAGRSR